MPGQVRTETSSAYFTFGYIQDITSTRDPEDLRK